MTINAKIKMNIVLLFKCMRHLLINSLHFSQKYILWYGGMGRGSRSGSGSGSGRGIGVVAVVVTVVVALEGVGVVVVAVAEVILVEVVWY